ncbi:MAG TPA: VIT domain-containing protein [Kofleriaceae bacterium]|nr:VIT domain-containing protein [Kofleriaceae bacterium]
MRVRAAILAFGIAMIVACPRADAASSGAALYIGNAPAPWVENKVDVDVRMGVAHGTVTQTFRNTSDRAAEAVYVFPLPTGAAVTAMRVSVGGHTIQATILPRPAAQGAYEAAVQAGKAAALTERERPGVYTQSIAPVPAGGEVAITLTWQARLDRKGGAWELAHPMVVGPRFVAGSATGAPTRGGGTAVDTDRAPDASRVTPPTGNGATTPFAFTLTIDDADSIVSPTHELALDPSARHEGPSVARVTDDRGSRELIVRWRGRATSGVRAVAEPAGKGAYIAVLVESEPEIARPRRTSRTWLVAIDRSASLDGSAAAHARAVAHGVVSHLRDDDQVAVVGVGERPRFTRATPAERRRADEQIDRLAVGTGDLTTGLATTLGTVPRGATTSVVLVTDGLVADDTAAIARAAAAGVVVHTVGVGNAPNRWLLEAIALRTGGTAQVITAPEDANVIAAALARAEPPLPVTVNWKKPTVEDAEPVRALALAGGATLIVAVDRKSVPSGEVEVVIGSRKLRAPIVRIAGTALATEWARQRVTRLWASGELDAATRLAVERGIVAPTTALVAAADGPGGDVVRSTVSVPVPLPAGMRRDALTRRAGDVDDLDRGGDDEEAEENLDGRIDAGGAGGGATGGEAAEPAPRAPTADESEVVYTMGGAVAERSLLGRAVSRRYLTLGLTLGARVDEPAPAAMLSLAFAQRVAPRTDLALRLDAGVAVGADIDQRFAGGLLLDVTRYALRTISLDVGAGIGWAGEVGFAYRAGLGTTRGPLSIGLHLSGAVTRQSKPATVGVGLEAAF